MQKSLFKNISTTSIIMIFNFKTKKEIGNIMLKTEPYCIQSKNIFRGSLEHIFPTNPMNIQCHTIDTFFYGK